MNAWVVTASKYGATHEIGAAIAERLGERGLAVERADARGFDPTVLDPADPLVLGSALYMGHWRKPAMELVGHLAAEPPGRPLWMFSSGPIGDPPKPDDARPQEAVMTFASKRARDHAVFAGRLDTALLSRRERVMVKALKAPEGDFRDWDAIAAWADRIADGVGRG
jgi:menaquinone-dependent protoporphyrinogen oxidase